MLKQIAILAVLSASPALAQQAADPAAASCGTLVGESATRIISMVTQLSTANAKVIDLQKQVDTTKPKDAPK